ncbi:serine/threonine-protein kinase [Streptomyces geranii]|uniref:serine/threonine-protein kinase n=1 Tax=Streptomyces geranii TaxID=2058923 RepID=UPI001E3E7296|nr:serine/threonine-protein kinase [Streptomyces geranii]
MTDEAAALRQTGAAPLRPTDPERVGPYVPLALLGSGGMGRVYLARPSDDTLGLFAVKVIRPEYAEDAMFRRRFEQEALVHGRVRTPRAPRLCGTGFQDELLWMATEYLPAIDLSDAVREGGALTPGAVWRLVAELGQALADLAATGIVHRDLKPSNVLLSLGGAHVIDFGISKAADASSITGTGNRVGTPAYMSPEYLRTGHSDAASDVFSLAGTLIYAAAGRAPFGDGTGVDVMHRVAFEEPAAEVIAEITAADPALGTLLSACLAKEPERRPAPAALIDAATAALARGAAWRSASGRQTDGGGGQRALGPGGRGQGDVRSGGHASGSPEAPLWPDPPRDGNDGRGQRGDMRPGGRADGLPEVAPWPDPLLGGGDDGHGGRRAVGPGGRAGGSVADSPWPEPLLGRVLERQRAYDVLYRVPVARAAELRSPGHRPNPALPVPVAAGGAEPSAAERAESAGAASAETSPGQRRPGGVVAWVRGRPVPAVALVLALGAVAALVVVLARPADDASAAPPETLATDSAGTVAEGGASAPVREKADGKSGPTTSGSGTESADGPAVPSQSAGSGGGGDDGEDDPANPDTGTDPTTGTDDTDTGTGTGTDGGTDGGTGTTPTPTPSPVVSTTEPANTAPWVTDCTYYAGKVRTAIGNTGVRVKQVQCILMLRGYDIGGTGVDGVFGEGLETAMKNFQIDKGLAVNGIVKRATWDNLRASK